MPTAVPQTLPLPKVIDLNAMEDVRGWLVEATARGDVDLQAQHVERCATNALLMLIAADKVAKSNGFKLKVSHPSDALNEAISRLGMGHIYADMIEGQQDARIDG